MADDTRCVQSPARESRPASGAFDRISRSCSCPLPLPVVFASFRPAGRAAGRGGPSAAGAVWQRHRWPAKPGQRRRTAHCAVRQGKTPRGRADAGEPRGRGLRPGAVSRPGVGLPRTRRPCPVAGSGGRRGRSPGLVQSAPEQLGSRPSLLNPSGMQAHSPWAWWPTMPACQPGFHGRNRAAGRSPPRWPPADLAAAGRALAPDRARR